MMDMLGECSMNGGANIGSFVPPEVWILLLIYAPLDSYFTRFVALIMATEAVETSAATHFPPEIWTNLSFLKHILLLFVW